MQVLVVMAGRGHRFKEAGINTPKPLIDINGRPMVKHTVDSLPFIAKMNPKDLAFAVLKEHRDEWAVDTILKEQFGDEITIIEIPEVTRGNLETAYIAIQYLLENKLLDLSEDIDPLIILDSDNVYRGSGLLAYIQQLDKGPLDKMPWAIICDFEPIDDKTHWCFAEKRYHTPGLDEFVLAVHEKHPAGPKVGNPMIGTFVFSSALWFYNLAKDVLAEPRLSQKEYYLSDAIARSLESNTPVYRFQVSDVRPLGTPEYLEKFKERTDRKLRICFDLDDTILHGKEIGNEYGHELPQTNAVRTLQRLHEEGHYIIIYTARHMHTCDGNVGKVLARQGLTTLQWLEDAHIPYDEIHFGKPHADLFVDDKGFRHAGSWANTEAFIRRFQDGEINETH